MKSASVIIKFLLLNIVLIITACSAIVPKAKEIPQQIGETPSYINIDESPEYTKFIIQKKRFSLVHSYKEERIIITGSEFYKVQMFLGPAGDCPSGCIYSPVTFVVPKDKNEIIQLPTRVGDLIESKAYRKLTQNQSLFKHLPIFENNVDISSLSKDATLKVTKRNGHYGWELESNKYLLGYKAFVYLEKDSETWDLSDFPFKISSIDEAIASLRSSSIVCQGYEVFQDDTHKIDIQKGIVGEGIIGWIYTIPIKCHDGTLKYAGVGPYGVWSFVERIN